MKYKKGVHFVQKVGWKLDGLHAGGVVAGDVLVADGHQAPVSHTSSARLMSEELINQKLVFVINVSSWREFMPSQNACSAGMFMRRRAATGAIA